MTILLVPVLLVAGLNMVVFNRLVAQWMIDANPFLTDDHWLGFARFMSVLVGTGWAAIGITGLAAHPAGSPWPWAVAMVAAFVTIETIVMRHRAKSARASSRARNVNRRQFFVPPKHR